MVKKLLTLILIFHIAIPSFAIEFPTPRFSNSQCDSSPINYITEGVPAYCSGWLYTDAANDQAAEDHSDAKHYKLINKKLTDRHDLMLKQSIILDKRLKLYMDQSHVLSQELQRKESMAVWKQTGWFLLGIVITGAAVYGAGQLNN